MRYSLYQLPKKQNSTYVITYNGSPTLVTDQSFKDAIKAIRYITEHRKLVVVSENRLATLKDSIKLADFDLVSTLQETHPELFL